MKKTLTACAFALSAATTAHARLPAMQLDCGSDHGAVAVLHPDAESGGIYDVIVTFFGRRPSNTRIEAAMRACLAESARRDQTTSAVAEARLRTRGASNEEPLLPFGADRLMAYSAATKTVSLRGPEPRMK
jgi:hypothetical protein